MCEIGVIPTMRRLSPQAYPETWRIIDRFMDRSMPPYKLGLLFVTATTLVSVLQQHYWWLGSALAFSFLLSLAALVYTTRQLLPLNK